jgi:hypothetical protein
MREGSDLTNAERVLFDDVVNELDCIGLGVLAKDLESAITPLRPRLQCTGTVAL